MDKMAFNSDLEVTVIDTATGEIIPVEDASQNHYFLDIRGALYSKTGLRLPRGVKYEQWERLLGTLLAIDEGVPWAIGDAINYGEHEYGEMYSQAIEATGMTYGRLSKLVYVARRWTYNDRRAGIPFSHYELLAPLMEKNRPLALELLDYAEVNHQTKRELAMEIERARAELEDGEVEVIPPGIQVGGIADASPTQENVGAHSHHDAASPRPNLTDRGDVGWLDDLLNIVQELVLTNNVEECWDVATKAARWAKLKGIPISYVYDIGME